MSDFPFLTFSARKAAFFALLFLTKFIKKTLKHVCLAADEQNEKRRDTSKDLQDGLSLFDSEAEQKAL